MSNTNETACQYSAMHRHQGVPATKVIDCGPVGLILACDKCAAFYAKN